MTGNPAFAPVKQWLSATLKYKIKLCIELTDNNKFHLFFSVYDQLVPFMHQYHKLLLPCGTFLNVPWYPQTLRCYRKTVLLQVSPSLAPGNPDWFWFYLSGTGSPG